MFSDAGVQVYGISTDPPAEHARFRASLDLPFPLLADEDGAVSRAYDSLIERGDQKLSARKIVLIDREGKIVYRDDAYQVGSDEAFDAMIAAVRAL
jgi:thioredoxin-dependent peroxiredoxin